MPKTRRPRNKRPRINNKNKLNIASWYNNCKICGALVVAPNSTGMWLHFNKSHPELSRSLVVPQPQVPIRDAHANTSSGNVGRKPQRKNDPRTPRKNLQHPKRKYHEMKEVDKDIAHTKFKSMSQLMGFCVQPDKQPKEQLIYRKQPARLCPPRFRKNLNSRNTYFDDDRNPYTLDQYKYSQGESEVDDDCTEVKSEGERAQDLPTESPRKRHVISQDTSLDDEGSKLTKAAAVPLPCDAEDNSDDENKDVKVEELDGSAVTQQVDSTRRRKRPKRDSKEHVFDTSGMPIELRNDPKMHKYWRKRHKLFSKYDEGIQLDRESWFSVTPEKIAREIANEYVYDVVLDAFCGAGGNTIQFAHTSKKVIAIDIDPQKISMARHNATVYGVADRIEFIVGDFFELAPTLKADMVFLSPPWGGPNYSDNHEYDLETMLEPKPASELMRVARTISSNVAFYLPRNSSRDQIISLAKEVGGTVEIDRKFLDNGFVAITAYYTKY